MTVDALYQCPECHEPRVIRGVPENQVRDVSPWCELHDDLIRTVFVRLI
jgi:hypothetical protein